MGIFSKATAVSVLLLAGFFLFGCTALSPDSKSLGDFAKLEQKYGVERTFSTNPLTMNDYISDLSVLRGTADASSAKVLDAELYSAQTFYYLNSALAETAGLDYSHISCSSTPVKQIISSVDLAKTYYTKAVASLSALSGDEKNVLRANQLEAVQGYGEKITQLGQFFDQKC